jgi:hypothetical protein
MADHLILNSNIAISKLPETSLSTMKTLAADFDGAVTSALNIQIPGVEKILNRGLIGTGDEFATQADPDYATHTGITFTDRLNTGQFAKLVAGVLSGTITSGEVVASSGAYDHDVEMKASDLDPQLKSRTVAFELGGYDFLMGGMVGNNMSITVQGGAAPTYQVELVGTGVYDYMASQSPSLVLPAPTAQKYVGQRSQTTLSFNDGTVFDMSSLGRAESFNLNFSNNIITGERRLGDPLTDSADSNAGAYVRQLTRGERTLQLSMGVYVGDDKRGYLAHLANTEITDLTFLSVSNTVIGATVYRHEVEVIVPKSVITSASLGGDRKGITTFNFEPLLATGETGIFKMRFRNATSSLT